MTSPLAMTSKMPPLPACPKISILFPLACFKTAARPTARPRYPQEVQNTISTFTRTSSRFGEASLIPLEESLRLAGDDDLLVGRHDPDLHSTPRGVDRHLAFGA